MTTPADPVAADEPLSDRDAAEELYGFVCQAIEALSNKATADELAARTPAERLAEAQLMTLQAVYRELRHGHDQAAGQTAALAEYAKALDGHADAMDKLRGALLEHADALSRYRRSN